MRPLFPDERDKLLARENARVTHEWQEFERTHGPAAWAGLTPQAQAAAVALAAKQAQRSI